ncbi:hypothetical protein PISMIDRAFT_254481 [Pisolithus microcarpus 441]|uniref:Helicase C-terminal domain-containing protein n=1 Tax=Pisolithus microcarpus 441 TaxID=765257 RepID=A0A0C9XW96_9AGAM|nr:hypothetical protein PISMIDRAFT_254481 [Pisolithus microcarpus 441]
MQLRKACSHPSLFDAGLMEAELYTGSATAEELVDSGGKMMVLERLLDELFARGHKVLLFSQFTTMLDIIETWATDLKGWNICRIDGKTDPLKRREQMNAFQKGGNRSDAPCLFLLSTMTGRGIGYQFDRCRHCCFLWLGLVRTLRWISKHRIGRTDWTDETQYLRWSVVTVCTHNSS